MDPKPKKIVELLIRKTRKHELDWQATINENSYSVAFVDSSIAISKRDGLSVERYLLEIINDEGDIVDSFSDIFFDDEILGDDEEWKRNLSFVFDLARREALKSESVLDSVLSALQR